MLMGERNGQRTLSIEGDDGSNSAQGRRAGFQVLSEKRGRDGKDSLFARVFAINATVLVAAVMLLALSPATVSAPITLTEALVLAGGLTAMLVANAFLVRRTFAPLGRIMQLMRRVDVLRPGERIPAYRHYAELTELTQTFNEMLTRLESERRDSTRRTLAGQEGERRRLAHELHDEIGQRLTALLLLLRGMSRHVPAQIQDQFLEAQEVARSSLDDLRRVVQRLRPGALEELGLVSALLSLSERFSEQTGLRVVHNIQRDLPPLSPDAELVIYRVTQESLTNIVRHASASHAELYLQRGPGVVTLRVADDGRGLDGKFSLDGSGIRGMRERALLVKGSLAIEPAGVRGVQVKLELPAEGESP
jgi:two-component system, NarL family, sensor histidine kinase UhpB